MELVYHVGNANSTCILYIYQRINTSSLDQTVTKKSTLNSRYTNIKQVLGGYLPREMALTKIVKAKIKMIREARPK